MYSGGGNSGSNRLCVLSWSPFEKFALSWLRTMFMHNGWYVYRSANFYAQFTPEEQSKKGRSRKKTKQKISEHSSEVEQNEQNQTD